MSGAKGLVEQCVEAAKDEIVRSYQVLRADELGIAVEGVIRAALRPLTEAVEQGMSSSEDDLSELRRLSEAASKGPWRSMRNGNSFDGNQHCGSSHIPEIRRTFHEDGLFYRSHPYAVTLRDEDADFIVAAVNHVRAMLSRPEEKREVQKPQLESTEQERAEIAALAESRGVMHWASLARVMRDIKTLQDLEAYHRAAFNAVVAHTSRPQVGADVELETKK